MTVDPHLFYKIKTATSPLVQKYEVKRISEEVVWPHDRDLIDFCVEGKMNWGGKVRIVANTAWVEAYMG